MANPQAVSVFHGPLLRQALVDSFKKLSPVLMIKKRGSSTA